MEGYLCSPVAQPLNKGCSKKAVTSDVPHRSGRAGRGRQPADCTSHPGQHALLPGFLSSSSCMDRSGPQWRRRKESKAGLRGSCFGNFPKAWPTTQGMLAHQSHPHWVEKARFIFPTVGDWMCEPVKGRACS